MSTKIVRRRSVPLKDGFRSTTPTGIRKPTLAAHVEQATEDFSVASPSDRRADHLDVEALATARTGLISNPGIVQEHVFGYMVAAVPRSTWARGPVVLGGQLQPR